MGSRGARTSSGSSGTNGDRSGTGPGLTALVPEGFPDEDDGHPSGHLLLGKDDAFPDHARRTVGMEGPAVLERIDIFPDPSYGIVNGRDDLVDSGYDDDVPGGKRPCPDPAPARVAAEDLAALRDRAGTRYKVVSSNGFPPELRPFRIIIFRRDTRVQVFPAALFSRDQVLKPDLDERGR